MFDTSSTGPSWSHSIVPKTLNFLVLPVSMLIFLDLRTPKMPVSYVCILVDPPQFPCRSRYFGSLLDIVSDLSNFVSYGQWPTMPMTMSCQTILDDSALLTHVPDSPPIMLDRKYSH